MSQVAAETFNFNPGSKQGLRGHAARSAGITVGAQAIKFVLRLTSMAVLARMLTPGDYGLVAMATAVTGVLGSIREAGLSSATIQRSEITHTQVSALFWLNLFLGCGIAVVCLASAPIAAAYFKHPELNLVIPALGAIGIIGSVGVQHTALMQRKMQFRQLMVRDVSGHIAGLAAGILAASLGAGFWSLVIMEAVSTTFSTAAIWLGCAWRPSSPGNFSEAKPLVKFGAHVTGGALIHHFSKGLDTLVLGGLFGSATVGLYSRAQHLLSTPMGQVVGPIMSVARPALSRAAESPERLGRATTDLLRLISLCCGAVICAMVPASDGIVRYALGPQWIESAIFFAGLAPFALVEPCGALLASVMVASGRPGELLKWRFFSIAIIAVGLAAGVSWGPKGVAVAYGASGLLLRIPLLMWYVSRLTGIPFRSLAGAVAPSVVIAIVAAAAGYGSRRLFPDPTSLAAVGAIAMGSLIVFVGLSVATKSGRGTIKQIRDLLVAMRSRKAGVLSKSE